MKPTPYIWMNGEFVKWEDASVHVLTHAMHYGSSVFEGIRVYAIHPGDNRAMFRGQAHFNRLIDSGRIYQMECPYSAVDLQSAAIELIRKNGVNACYVRPIVYRAFGPMGLYPMRNDVHVAIALWEWDNYLGEASLESGIRCKISSWLRIDTRMLPPLSKCAANYANSALAKIEAIDCGFDEAIMLNANGTVAEGSAENIFMVKNGQLVTPPSTDGALLGITRDTVITLAREMGFSVTERSIIRDELFIADEVFFTGTAVEVIPICEIDGRRIKSNGRGPITTKIQSAYFDAVTGQLAPHIDWLDFVR